MSAKSLTANHTPITRNERIRLRMLEREKSEASPLQIPDEALPQVKQGLDQCFYCGLFGHRFRACSQYLDYLPRYGAHPMHWRLLENGSFYEITAIWPSTLDAELGQPWSWSLNRLEGRNDEHLAASSVTSDEVFYDAFESIPTAATNNTLKALSRSESFDDADGEGRSNVFGQPSVQMTSSSMVPKLASPTIEQGKIKEAAAQADLGAED
ncbi:uncharacterized protein MELLADRAFT_108834 [Melampsora larici-populina 98AG31]|uniref:CCHC-type domain-containing protein n=1 Tax=Melampsora larici-populina (strain 98AG31 / pathotype 3-4-7) TaxID=747676 RepID=F4RUF2_MELLP|nr:uncharacterized protein MELLADRAFT_108834 [Melampsora larici-populina 98AG31]EGG04009.1 hypothetical protein MELLADRAFT_108834 [Melampsora larici-populina 98AG31]